VARACTAACRTAGFSSVVARSWSRVRVYVLVYKRRPRRPTRLRRGYIILAVVKDAELFKALLDPQASY
jgi:hypothetical protein